MPLRMTSVIDSPRRVFAELSPITQRTASMILDLPQPFGPTTAHILLGRVTFVGSTNDLNPDSEIDFKRIEPQLAVVPPLHSNQNTTSSVPTKAVQHYMQIDLNRLSAGCGIQRQVKPRAIG